MEEEKLTPQAVDILREKENELIEIIEAFNFLEQSEEWNTVKKLVYSKSLASIERQLMSEAQKFPIQTDKLYKLQGEWEWAKRFSDTSRHIDALKKQLAGIKQQLKNEQ